MTLARAGLAVLVLEARRAGTGASGRNGGFVLRGLAPPYDQVRRPELMELTEETIDRLAELAGDVFRRVGSLRLAVDDDELAALRSEHEALAGDGFAVEWRDAVALEPALQRYLGGIFHPTDGAFHQGRWIRRLAAHAEEAGARIAEETPATAIDGTVVDTDRGTVSADAVVVATDGYTDGLVAELDEALVAFRGQVVATEPIAERVVGCPVYARWGYDYFQQLVDGRVVFGGRRDADLEAEATRDERPTDAIQARIEDGLRDLLGDVPPITHRWAGLMGFSPDYLPLVGRLPGRDGVWASVGYSGHGNVLGFACGQGVANEILGRPDARLTAFNPERILAARPPA